MRDDLDRLIDAGLSKYSSAEPLAGLEQRLLNRVRAAEASRRRRWWWAAVALAAPAVAAILFLAPARRPAPAPIAASTPPPPVLVDPAPVPRIDLRPAAPVKPLRARPRRPAPRKQVFPTPSPLTREERLLVQLAESRPQMLLARPVDEIEIKPIEIAPLNIDGNH